MTAKKATPAAAVANLPTAPLARFALAPENVRHGVEHDPEGLAALAGSIADFGRVLEPLKVYADGDSLMVWDGGRRLAALRLLAARDEPPALLDAVAYQLTDRDEAGLASMATFLRAPLHPAEAFLAYSALFDAGQTPERIAAACAVSAKEVAQLLRFRVLAPEVLAAFKAGGMDLDAALAFTVTDDHDAQRSVLASFGDRQPEQWQVRRALKGEAIDGDDFRAKVVGREAYEAAGGRFLLDLFSWNGEREERWQDSALVARLFEEKREALLAEVRAEGWAEVIWQDDRWGWGVGLHDVEPEGDDFTDEERAQLVAIVHPDRDGLTVERGWRSHRTAKGVADGAAPDTAAPVKPAQADPARWGWGHGGHEQITAAATFAVRRALIADPAAAYDGLVSHLAWEALGHGERFSGLAVTGYAAQAVEREAVEAWEKRLPCRDRPAFVAAVEALDADDKARLLALAFALTIDVKEVRNDGHRSARWAHFGWLARRAGVQPADVMQPAADFLKLGSRPALLAAVADLSPGEEARKADAKKGALVAWVADKAAAAGWVPQLVRDLLTAPAAAPEAAAKPAKGKGRGKGKAAPVEANDDAAVPDAA